MRKDLRDRIEGLSRRGRSRKAWQRVVRFLGIAVVFCTTYALILPAITMEDKPVCGLEEHSHSQSCYEQREYLPLTCQVEAGVSVLHVHDAMCYDETGTLRCALPELREHTHTQECYGRVLTCTEVHTCTDACVTVERKQICTETERAGHTHGEACTGTIQVLSCSVEEEGHVHDDSCYTQQTQTCTLKEDPGHAHTESCFESHEVPCPQKGQGADHVHDESCYGLGESPVCGMVEITAHTHGDGCYDESGALICGRPVVTAHTHTESCLGQQTQTRQVLVCTLQEHTHLESCYPLESEESQPAYFCGLGEHIHEEACRDDQGALVCTIPEHSHTLLCKVSDLDLTADVETAEQWEAPLKGLYLSGNWAEDLVAVAKTQLGYRESRRNLACVDGALLGYTRYGEKYGDPYAPWSAMFGSFCLEYAKVGDFPRETQWGQWIRSLTDRQLFAAAGAYIPQAGDLVFLTGGEDADAVGYLGIVTQVLADSGEIRIVAGNDREGCVREETHALTDPALVGYGRLPENPDYDAQTAALERAVHLISALPEAEQAKQELKEWNLALDRERFEMRQKELTDCAAAARAAWEALTEEQKAQFSGYQKLTQLEDVCAQTLWQQLPALTTDDAVVSLLEAVHLEETTEETVKADHGTTALLGFRLETASHTGTAYGEARVKLAFILEAEQKQAAFDLDAMPWLEEPSLTVEQEKGETPRQILTGYLHLRASRLDEPVVPGTGTYSIGVKPMDMAHGQTLNVQISAAMEHNTWQDVCPTHEKNETLTIQSKTLVVSNPASPEEQLANYEAMLAKCQAALELPEEEQTTQLEALWDEIYQLYLAGGLAEDAFAELSTQVQTLIYGDLNAIAESREGHNWELLRDSGWFEAYTGEESQWASQNVMSASMPAMSGVTTYAQQAPSSVQIREQGGSRTSADGAVSVSKTIAGTDVENVFDITLSITTQDVVTEVYKEPDMAVVVVMDISNTMLENFGGTTRYAAAMTAAENFLDQFAANNKGASKVGFVAFNTDAYQIFGMQACTSATVKNLKSTMRTQTGKIINQNGYAESHSRFTNVEGGLKRARDMLGKVSNTHKYIIFLSDGFPTTYVSSGYSGYDPYDASGARFYDRVSKKPCTYGTSYSDEAAIRARKMAVDMKNSGIKIFSIGVDIGGQTIQKYVNQGNRTFSVVDRYSTSYEIGSADSKTAYANWLKDKIGSGDGYYFDSTNSSGLTNAFDDIFKKIKELNAASSHLDWVATDPIPGMGVHGLEAVDFIGFFTRDGVLTGNDLQGQGGNGWENENTASFDTGEKTIYWDIKNSGYIGLNFDDTTQYTCELKYRVRLNNHNSGFVERDSYVTNDTTTLTYRVIEQKDSAVSISERRTIAFPIPAVEGYLSELEFTKVDSLEKPLPGAEFTLAHDTTTCTVCRGDNTPITMADMVAVSDSEGKVHFWNIPSGHTYTLTETMVPEGYLTNGNTYRVTVAYDTLAVSVSDSDGNPLTWEKFIENLNTYTLPETGGSGTFFFTFGGLLAAAAACVYLTNHFLRKNRKGGAYCRR